LQSQGYRGFAAFDIKYDERAGRLKVLELNARQGRGNYYVTGSGANIARVLVEDILYSQTLKPVLEAPPFLWLVTPSWVARSCSTDPSIQQQVATLLDSGQWANPLDYAPDRSPLRWLWLKRNERLQVQRFKNWCDSESEL